MSFTKNYGKVLAPFVKKYNKAKNEKERKTLVKNAADAVKKSKLLLEDQDNLPKDLDTSIRRYIERSLKKDGLKVEEENDKPKKVKKFYTARDVVKYKHRDLIDQEIALKSNDPNYIGGYQRAVTTVLNGLDREEIEEVVEMWNEEGGPSGLQQKRAQTKLPKEIRKKVEEWQFTSGAVILCLVAYPKEDCKEEDEDKVQSFHIEGAPISGQSFTKYCPDWREGTYQKFKDWALLQFGVEEYGSDDNGEIPVRLQKAKDIEFGRNTHGDFILPPISNFKTMKEKQRVVRGYIGAVYRDFTNNKRAAFPYSLASKENQTIYSEDSVPEGFTLSDPDHLTSPQIESLYLHWRIRQMKKLSPFVILNASPQHQSTVKKMSAKAKGKRKIDYMHVSTSDSDVEDEDGDREDNVDDGEGDDEDKDEEDQEDQEREMSPPIKRGPPPRKAKKIPSSTQKLAEEEPIAGSSKLPPPPSQKKPMKKKQPVTRFVDEEEPVAGSSKLTPPPKKSLRKKETKDGKPSKRQGTVVGRKNGKGMGWSGTEKDDLEDEETPIERPRTRESAKVAKSQKRKREEDLETAPPPKVLKRDRDGRSGRKNADVPIEDPMRIERGKKRKAAEEEEEPTPKRKRVNEKKVASKRSGKVKRERSPSPSLVPRNQKQPSIPPTQPLGRVREAGRVKEFPAGNSFTSASRMAFLRTLCNLPKFRLMVDLISPMPRATEIPKNYPSWASWRSRELYLPASFHNFQSFDNALSTARNAFGDSKVFKDGKIDPPLLLLGLLFREVSRAMEIEPGTPPPLYPQQLVDSPFGIKEMEQIREMLEAVEIPSD